MSMTGIVSAALVIGIVGLLVGVLLVIAGSKFHVQVDEREAAVRALLPGNNCGGCGFAGCDAVASAIVKGEAEPNACPVGGVTTGKKIAEIMGVYAGDTERKVAFVKCAGTCEKARQKSTYYGVKDCRMAVVVPGKSSKKCTYGCMGFGTCVKVCPFDAIHLADGIAVVDSDACKACGKCVEACPNKLIELVPFRAVQKVQCNSNEKGKAVREACEAGCMGCGICAKNCPSGAITVENNLAKIDYETCTGCGTCAEKCPRKVISCQRK